MTDELKKGGLAGEILPSSSIGGYMMSIFGLGDQGMPDNPSWVWEQLRINPWLAIAVYEDLEDKDDQIYSCLETRKENVMSKTRRVVAGGDMRQDRKLAGFIEDTLEGYYGGSDGTRIGVDSMLWEMLDAVGKGVAIGEIIYDEAPDRIYIKDVRFKPQHLFSFSEGALVAHSSATFPYPQTGPLRLRPGIFGEGFSSETPLNPKKFLVHTYRPRHGNRWGSALLKKCYWLSWIKRGNVKNWLRYGEKGAGSIVAKYPGGSTAEVQTQALAAAQAIAQEAAIAIPDKFVIELLEHVRGGGLGTIYRELGDDFCNNGLARIILGQTLTSRGGEGGGGARALGEVHERVGDKKSEADCKSLIMSVNTQIVWPLVLLNEGPVKRPPMWMLDYEPGADLTTTAVWLQKLWEMYVPISRKFVYSTFAGTEPVNEDDELVAEPEPAAADPTQDDEEENGEGFAEVQKKKLASRSTGKSSKRPILKTDRFMKLHHSTTPHSAK